MDARKESLGGIVISRGFYDPGIQKVLCRRKTIIPRTNLDPLEEQFHLAWPLIVLAAIDSLQTNCECKPQTPIKNSNLLEFYREDPVFTSELLCTFTSYAKQNPSFPLNTPDKITLEQALAEYASLPGKNGRCSDFAMSDWNKLHTMPALPGELAEWKTVADCICKYHPHLKRVAKADLLKAYHHKEKKRRERIVNHWDANLEAYWKDVIVFIQFPDGPNLSYYAESSVTATAPK
jgi:hypothetical protein